MDTWSEMNEGLWQKWHQNVQNAPQIKWGGGGGALHN